MSTCVLFVSGFSQLNERWVKEFCSVEYMCTVSGFSQLNERWTKEDCSVEYMCTLDDTSGQVKTRVVQIPLDCDEASECKLRDGKYVCECTGENKGKGNPYRPDGCKPQGTMHHSFFTTTF